MKKTKFIAAFIIVFGVMLSSFAFYSYQVLFTPNILINKQDQFFAIPKKTTFKELQERLMREGIVNDLVSFSFLSRLKDYDTQIKPGMYLLKKDMSNTEAINLLRAGIQTPVKLTFTSARKIEDLSSRLTEGLMIDSLDMAPLLLSDSVARTYGFDSLTFISMFLPNTYEVYWTISPKELLDRMHQEYRSFWSEKQIAKARSIGLSPIEVATLASIVGSETNKMDEAPTIAGVYINRLKRGIPLQADPTLVFAIGDFSIRRILNKDKSYVSPYNTYLNRGLPPGPIKMPSISALEAVLNYEDHRYLYFCAKADFSGYHVFASTLTEHNRNAREFQRALNQERIYR